MTQGNFQTYCETTAGAWNRDLITSRGFVKIIIEAFRDAQKFKAAYALRDMLDKTEPDEIDTLATSIWGMIEHEDVEESVIELWEEEMK